MQHPVDQQGILLPGQLGGCGEGGRLDRHFSRIMSTTAALFLVPVEMKIVSNDSAGQPIVFLFFDTPSPLFMSEEKCQTIGSAKYSKVHKSISLPFQARMMQPRLLA